MVEGSGGGSGDGGLNFSMENSVSNHFGDLGDDGVAESSKSVHPAGYPMSHSTHWGFNCPPAICNAISLPTILCNFARAPLPPFKPVVPPFC